MARRPHDAQGAEQRAREVLSNASNADELRAAQAALLPLLGLSLEQTAEIVGRDRFWVSRTRNRFLRGEALATHGGRRNSLVTSEIELKLVKLAFTQHGVSLFVTESVRKMLRTLLEEHTDSSISESTISEVLDRVASKIIPGAKGTDLTDLESHFARIWRTEKKLAEESNISWP